MDGCRRWRNQKGSGIFSQEWEQVIEADVKHLRKTTRVVVASRRAMEYDGGPVLSGETVVLKPCERYGLAGLV